MAAVTVRASSGGVTRAAGATRTFTYPGTPVAGDIIGIWSSSDANPTMTTPSGWTLGYSANVVNGSRHFIWQVYASGTSVNVTYSADPNLAWAIVVLDGSVHSSIGTLGTITTRGGSSTTASALATGSSAVPNLVVFHEKASSHPAGPSISPTTTSIQSQWDTTAAGASVYVGTYDDAGGTADRTATYSTASTNGAGVQIPVTLASVSFSSSPALSGSGTLSAVANGAAAGSASLSGSGTLGTTQAVVTAYPQSGAVAATTGTVLYVTSGVTSARVVYSTSSTLASPSYSGTLTPDADGVVSAALTGLTADTLYYYGLEVSGTLIAGGRGRFRTYPTGQASGSFLFGSCQFTDSNHAVFATIAAHTTPHTNYGFLHLGDLHYRDWQVNGITSAATIKAQQKSSTQQSNFAALLATYPWTYTWDNHDWGGAASDASNAAASAIEAMYRQMTPHYTLPTDADDNTGAIDQTWDFGRVSFFMLDTRSQRSAGNATDNSSKTMLGAGQKARLKAWMASTSKPVKVIVSGIPWKNYAGAAGDRWGAYLTEFAELSTYFTASGYGSLFSITGDIHRNAADDGTNESFGHVPNALSSPFDQSGGTTSGFSQGIYPTTSGAVTSHNFGELDITDNGSTIVLAFTGYDDADASNITLTKTYTLAVAANATLSGSGTLTRTGGPSTAAAPSFTGSGTLTSTSSPGGAASATLSGSGSLSTQTGNGYSGSVSLDGSGSLSVSATPAVAPGATMSGVGVLTAAIVVDFAQEVGLSGSGSLGTDALVDVAQVASLSGAGSLSLDTAAAGPAHNITVAVTLGTRRWSGAIA